MTSTRTKKTPAERISKARTRAIPSKRVSKARAPSDIPTTHQAQQKAPAQSSNPSYQHEDVVRSLISRSYCLWLGAGVSKQLAAGTGIQIPLWSELVISLEAQCNLCAVNGLSPPERLSRIKWAVGNGEFQRLLRERIAVPVASALLAQLEAWVKSGEVPSVIDQLALFGAFSTSVVNFNIETVTSRIAAAASPYVLKIFHPPAEGSSGWKHVEAKFDGHGTGAVPLSVIHPHGAIDRGGLCVMTSDEYRLLNGSLGLEIAVHQCFEDNVLILGMSLDDEYLRRQLTAFRSQIKRVYWLTLGTPSDGALHAWAVANRIDIVAFNSPGEMWEMFSRYADAAESAPDIYFLLMATTHERRLQMALRMADQVPQMANLAFDVSVLSSHALQQLRAEPDPREIRGLGAKLVWGSDRGEDPSGAGDLTDPQKQMVHALSGGLRAWETKTREDAEKLRAEQTRRAKQRLQRRLREMKRQEAEEPKASKKRRKPARR